MRGCVAFGLGAHGGLDLGGALAERVRVPWADTMLIPVPDGLDPDVTAIADNVDASGGWDMVDLGCRFPITVDANFLDHGRELALRAVEPFGVCTSVSGGTAPRSSLPFQQMYLKGVHCEIGRVHAMATAPRVLELVDAGRLDPGAIVTKTVPFTDAVAGMTDPAVKIVFVNDLDPEG